MAFLDAAYRQTGLTGKFNNMCKNQLVRSSHTMQNFTVLGTTLVIALSMAVIVTALTLPLCVDLSRARRMRKGRSSANEEAVRLACFVDEKYRLLAVALGSSDVGVWGRGKGGIPVTKADANLLGAVKEGGLPSRPINGRENCSAVPPTKLGGYGEKGVTASIGAVAVKEEFAGSHLSSSQENK